MELFVEAFVSRVGWSPEAFPMRTRMNGRVTAYLRLRRYPSPMSGVGMGLGERCLLIDPEAFRVEATDRLRAGYADFMERFAVESGLTRLYRWQKQVSWWWFTGLSEHSVLRTPMIQQLYWLLIFDAVLRRHSVTHLHLATDDPALMAACTDLARTYGIGVTAITVRSAEPLDAPLGRWMTIFSSWLRQSAVQLANWFILRAAGFRPRLQRVGSPRGRSIILYSRFPSLWERSGGLLRERRYGHLPEQLEAQGYSVRYAAILTQGPRGLCEDLAGLRQACAQQVILLESVWSLADVLRVCFTPGPVWRYLAWRRRQSAKPIRFGRIDIRHFLLRELDRELASWEFRTDLGIDLGMRRLIKVLGDVQCVMHPFEYQPMERALWSGVKSADARTPVVGLQTSMVSAGHVSFFIPTAGGRQFALEHGLAPVPLPDFLAACGRHAYDVWRERLEPTRVVLVGPIRYPALRVGRANGSTRGREAGGHRLLVAGTSCREETLAFLQEAMRFARDDEQVTLCFKFHYHCTLTRECQALARSMGVTRYQVADSDLNALIRRSSAVVTGQSSVAIEAIVLGTMPLIYRPPGTFLSDHMLELGEGGFLWSRDEELRAGFRECLTEGPEYQRRKALWPSVLDKTLYGLDGQAASRLCEFLTTRRVLCGQPAFANPVVGQVS